jgi:peptidoglycan hydrolase CwlO-like protein
VTIAELEAEHDQLVAEATEVEGAMGELSDVIAFRVRETFMFGSNLDPIAVFLASEDPDAALSRAQTVQRLVTGDQVQTAELAASRAKLDAITVRLEERSEELEVARQRQRAVTEQLTADLDRAQQLEAQLTQQERDERARLERLRKEREEREERAKREAREREERRAAARQAAASSASSSSSSTTSGSRGPRRPPPPAAGRPAPWISPATSPTPGVHLAPAAAPTAGPTSSARTASRSGRSPAGPGPSSVPGRARGCGPSSAATTATSTGTCTCRATPSATAPGCRPVSRWRPTATPATPAGRRTSTSSSTPVAGRPSTPTRC